MNILAVGAHPDDIETYCAGTLAKYKSLGHKVFMATATNGNIGSSTHSMEEIAKIRKAEAAKSAAIIGAEYICLDYDDEMFFEDKEVRLKFIDLVRYCQADVILTHNPKDYNPDHELTSKIINDIAVMIPIAHLKTKNPPCDKIPKIFYWETVYGLGFVPTDYVDITDFFETKKQMLNCHESQKKWMADNYKDAFADDPSGESFFENILLTARYRGMQSGVKYAEAFIRANDAFRMSTDRVLP
jgi:LmbE family N-acetylglucosaminyl deacetylase